MPTPPRSVETPPLPAQPLPVTRVMRPRLSKMPAENQASDSAAEQESVRPARRRRLRATKRKATAAPSSSDASRERASDQRSGSPRRSPAPKLAEPARTHPAVGRTAPLRTPSTQKSGSPTSSTFDEAYARASHTPLFATWPPPPSSAVPGTIEPCEAENGNEAARKRRRTASAATTCAPLPLGSVVSSAPGIDLAPSVTPEAAPAAFFALAPPPAVAALRRRIVSAPASTTSLPPPQLPAPMAAMLYGTLGLGVAVAELCRPRTASPAQPAPQLLSSLPPLPDRWLQAASLEASRANLHSAAHLLLLLHPRVAAQDAEQLCRLWQQAQDTFVYVSGGAAEASPGASVSEFVQQLMLYTLAPLPDSARRTNARVCDAEHLALQRIEGAQLVVDNLARHSLELEQNCPCQNARRGVPLAVKLVALQLDLLRLRAELYAGEVTADDAQVRISRTQCLARETHEAVLARSADHAVGSPSTHGLLAIALLSPMLQRVQQCVHSLFEPTQWTGMSGLIRSAYEVALADPSGAEGLHRLVCAALAQQLVALRGQSAAS